MARRRLRPPTPLPPVRVSAEGALRSIDEKLSYTKVVSLSWPGAAHAGSAGGSPTRTERPVNVRYGGGVIRTRHPTADARDQPHDPQRKFDTSPQNV